jgi:hypothetical protein
MRPIRIVTLALLVTAVVIFTGCFAISSEDAAQQDGIGDIQVTTVICSTNFAPPGGCPSGNQDSSSNSPSNLLLAYRVPDGTGTPPTLTGDTGSTGGSGPPPVTFTKDTAYTTSLNQTAPLSSGEHWVGYVGDSTGSTSETVVADFQLPSPGAGHPFQGPFNYRTVVGWEDNEASSGRDDVQCASDPTQISDFGSGSHANCIDYPASSALSTDNQVATRDLALSGTDTTAPQATTASIPFSAVFAGSADSSATFDLSVQSDAPSTVKLTASPSSFAPGSDSTTPLTVTADVDPSAPLGTYNVTLVARNSAGQTRQATAKLTVALGTPVNLALPFVGGTAAVGQALNCNQGSWSSSPTGYAYQWTRNGSDIAGATSQSYTLTEDDGAQLVTCRETATNAVGSASATAGAVRVAQEGGANVDLSGPVHVKKNSDGTYTIDPGITVKCPPHLTVNCGGSDSLTTDAGAANAAHASATTTVAHSGFSVKSGSSQKIVLHVTGRGARLLRLRKKLTLVATVTTRNHLLQRVKSRKRFTARG